MRNIKTLGLEKATKYSKEGYLDIWGDFTNQRKAHCKVCGNEILKDKGIATYFYALQVSSRHRIKCGHGYGGSGNCICDVRHQTVFVCPYCDEKISKINQELEAQKK